MMKPEECVEAWKTIIECYDNSIEKNNPEVTMNKIIETLGLDKTEEVFATVAAIKSHDGRIYGKNREYMNSIIINPECVEWKHENPMIYAGLDHIHTAHINNLITELWKVRKY